MALQEAFDVLQQSGADPKPTLEMLTATLVATPGNQRYARALLGVQVPVSAIPGKDIGLFRRFVEAVSTQTPLAERMHEILTAGTNG